MGVNKKKTVRKSCKEREVQIYGRDGKGKNEKETGIECKQIAIEEDEREGEKKAREIGTSSKKIVKCEKEEGMKVTRGRGKKL